MERNGYTHRSSKYDSIRVQMQALIQWWPGLSKTARIKCPNLAYLPGLGIPGWVRAMPASSRASSSGESGSRCLDDCERMEPSVHFSLEGLATKWDNTELVRTRLREHQQLCRHWDPKTGDLVDQHVDKNTLNVKANQEVLSPVLKLMAQNKLAVPSIDNIIQQVDILYKKAKHPMGNGDRLYQEGWAIRRLASYLKSLTYKDHPPKEMGSINLFWKHGIHGFKGAPDFTNHIHISLWTNVLNGLPWVNQVVFLDWRITISRLIDSNPYRV